MPFSSYLVPSGYLGLLFSAFAMTEKNGSLDPIFLEGDV